MGIVRDIRKALRSRPEQYRPPRGLIEALKFILRGRPKDLAAARARLCVDTTARRATPETEEQRLAETLHQCLRLGMWHMLDAAAVRATPAKKRIQLDYDEKVHEELREVLRQMRVSGAHRKGVVLPQTLQQLVMRLVRKGLHDWKLNEERGGANRRAVARSKLAPGEKQPVPASFGVVLSGEAAAKARAGAIAEGITLGAWVGRACLLVADGEEAEGARTGSR